MRLPEGRETSLSRMAWACAALVLVITSLSAFLRLAPAAPAAAVTAARIAHRLAAGMALVVVLLMAMMTLAQRPLRWGEAAAPLAMLGLVLFLAVLGRIAGDARTPAVTMSNLLGGFGLFALACFFAARVVAPWQGGPDPWAWGGVALLAAGSVSGAWLAAAQRGSVAHSSIGMLTALLVLPAAVSGWRRGRRAAAAGVLLLLVAELVLGVGSSMSVAAAVGHNIVAALLLGTLATFPGASGRVR